VNERGTPQARIDVRRLAKKLVLVVVLPGVIVVAADFWLGTWPVLTVVEMVLWFPFAVVLVNRATVEEMERVIQRVAPEPGDDGGDSDKTNG
jgi:hypothetical protein